MRLGAGRGGWPRFDGAPVRALLACPPLGLSAFAFSTAALLGERLLAALGRGALAEPAVATWLFWIGLSGAFGAFWLLCSLRLAGLVASPPSRLTGIGALATAGVGAILAPIDLGRPEADVLAVGLSATCFATFFLLRAAPSALRAGAGRSRELTPVAPYQKR
jgi:hypothetical protein